MDDHALVQVLDAALSPDASVRGPAERALSDAEGTDDLLIPRLLRLAQASASLERAVLAVLCAKNAIGRRWRARKSAPSLSTEAKTAAREAMLSLVASASHDAVARHAAVCCARATRLERAGEWPNLIDHLCAAVRSEGTIRLRALLTLYYVVKEQSSRCLAPDRRVFAATSAAVLPVAVPLAMAATSAAVAGSDSAALEVAPLAAKLCRRLVVQGTSNIQQSPDAQQFLGFIAAQLPGIAQACEAAARSGAHDAASALDRTARAVIKTVIDLVERQPVNVHAILPKFLDLFLALAAHYVSVRSDEDAGGTLQRMALLGVEVVRSTLASRALRPRRGGTPAAETVGAFFTPERVAQGTRLATLQLMLLSRDELSEWSADPESYYNAQDAATGRESAPVAGEGLLCALAMVFTEQVTEVLTGLLKESQDFDIRDLDRVVMRDAVLRAVGAAAFDIAPHLSAAALLEGEAARVLDTNHAHAAILQRRFCALSGQLTEQLKQEQRPPVYVALSRLLAAQDVCVRLEAAAAVARLIDDVDFYANDFAPVLDSTMAALFGTIADANEPDTALKCLHAVSTICEHCGRAVAPHAGSIVSALPRVWESAAEVPLLRTSVISALRHLTEAIGPAAVGLSDTIGEAVSAATDSSSEEALFLMEDGLGLWGAALRQLEALPPSFAGLYSRILAIATREYEFLPLCTKIIESYALIAPDAVRASAAETANALVSILEGVRDKGCILTASTVELLVRAANAPEWDVVLRSMLRAVVTGESASHVVVAYNNVLARLLASDKHRFFALFEGHADALAKWVDQVLDTIDCIYLAPRRKIAALALSEILALGNIDILQPRMGALLGEICGVLFHMEGDSALIYEPVSGPEDEPDSAEEPESARRAQVVRADPLRTAPLRERILSALSSCENSMGSERFAHLMGSVDPAITAQIRERLA